MSSGGVNSIEERRLFETLNKIDALLLTQDLGGVDALFTKDSVFHKDGITLPMDLKGIDAVKGYYEQYFKDYAYRHVPVALGLNESRNIGFSFSIEEKVTPTSGQGEQPGMPAEANEPSYIYSLSKYEFNKDLKCTDAYLYRQMGKDEMYARLKNPEKVQQASREDAAQLAKIRGPELEGSDKSADPELLKKRMSMAREFSEIWSTGDPSPADKILAEDVKSSDVIFASSGTQGREAWKQMINGVFKGWTSHGQKNDVAITPDGSKAFVSWTNEGVEKSGDHNLLSGMSMLLFNKAGQISDVIAFRSPLESEKPSLFK